MVGIPRPVRSRLTDLNLDGLARAEPLLRRRVGRHLLPSALVHEGPGPGSAHPHRQRSPSCSQHTSFLPLSLSLESSAAPRLLQRRVSQLRWVRARRKASVPPRPARVDQQASRPQPSRVMSRSRHRDGWLQCSLAIDSRKTLGKLWENSNCEIFFNLNLNIYYREFIFYHEQSRFGLDLIHASKNALFQELKERHCRRLRPRSP